MRLYGGYIYHYFSFYTLELVFLWNTICTYNLKLFEMPKNRLTITKTRIKSVLFFIIFLGLSFNSCNQSTQKAVELREPLASFNALEYPNKNITDGPYVFYENGEIILKWIEQDKLIVETINESNITIFKKNFGIDLKYEWLKENDKPLDYKQEYKNVDKIIAISDVHGQYKLFVKILREYKVIDKNNNWSFGNGNLVIVGDIFDRGDQVNEALWMVYKLRHQALEQGGRVHYTIGNHEEMIINKDLRYVNEKYIASAEKMNLDYDQLYGKNTVIGHWIRSNPVILQINDILFVHAGISPEVVDKGFTAEQMNKAFLDGILGQTKLETEQDSVLTFLRGNKGPIWYRGYFYDNDLKSDQIDVILNHFNKKHIVVGHTSQESIVSLFRDRVFGIDSSIKNGKYGEVLIYDKGDFFRGPIKLPSKY